MRVVLKRGFNDVHVRNTEKKVYKRTPNATAFLFLKTIIINKDYLRNSLQINREKKKKGDCV